jgi:hypothetical protein
MARQVVRLAGRWEGALPPQPLRHPPAMHFHRQRSGTPTRDTLGGYTRQSEADRQSGPASGTIRNSASPDPGLGLRLSPEDGELRSARPRARTRAQPGRRRTPLRLTQGSDSGSALEDGELRSARPRARTWAQPRKTANSDTPDPRARTRAQPRKTTDSISPDPRARTQPWPQPTVSASLDPGART